MQVRLTKRHQGEVEQVSERLVHEAAVRQTDLQLEITAADRRHDTRTDELRTRQTRGIDRLKIQIQEILSKQQEKLLVDLDYVYVQPLDGSFESHDCGVCVCARGARVQLRPSVSRHGTPGLAHLAGTTSSAKDILIGSTFVAVPPSAFAL